MEQNEKGLMQWEKDFLISITILIIATIIAHIFFYQTAHNINVPMIYTLATFFISVIVPFPPSILFHPLAD